MSAPLPTGALHDTSRVVLFLAVTVGAAGAAGFCAAGVPTDDADQAPSPTLLVARTCTWYLVPLVRLPMVAVVAVPVWLWEVQLLGQVGLLVLQLAVQARYCTS